MAKGKKPIRRRPQTKTEKWHGKKPHEVAEGWAKILIAGHGIVEGLQIAVLTAEKIAAKKKSMDAKYGNGD